MRSWRKMVLLKRRSWKESEMQTVLTVIGCVVGVGFVGLKWWAFYAAPKIDLPRGPADLSYFGTANPDAGDELLDPSPCAPPPDPAQS